MIPTNPTAAQAERMALAKRLQDLSADQISQAAHYLIGYLKGSFERGEAFEAEYACARALALGEWSPNFGQGGSK
jgi:hypothetical protein